MKRLFDADKAHDRHARCSTCQISRRRCDFMLRTDLRKVESGEEVRLRRGVPQPA